MSIFKIEQRLALSRAPTGLERQAEYDRANRSVDPKSVAKPRLRKFAIAVRPIGGAFDNRDPVIINARNAHDNGWGVMFSETTKTWSVLYYQPHLYRVKRKPYFNVPMQEE